MDKVIVVDHRFDDLEIEHSVLSQLDVELQDAGGLDRDSVLRAAKDASAILVGARFKLDAQAISGLARCKVIVRYGVGFNNVDVGAANAAGIAVAYVPDYCTEEVAVHALALILALNRQLLVLDEHVRAGEWGIPSGLEIRRLSSCVLGIVGFGRIGEAVARRAVPLGMRVLAHDPLRPPDEIIRAGAGPVDLRELLVLSDYVSLHAPPASDDRPLIGAAELALMKSGAALVNLGRAGLVNETDLVNALREGHLAGAALDVTTEEPLYPPHPLLDAPNLIVTPHAAWFSLESSVELRRKAAEEVARALRGEALRCPA